MRACWQCGRRSCTPEAEGDLEEGELEEGELEGEAEGEASGDAAEIHGDAAEIHAEVGGAAVSSQRGAARR